VEGKMCVTCLSVYRYNSHTNVCDLFVSIQI
jgi:hypothetical protein